MQRTQLAKDLHRQRVLGARVAEELQRAREQMRKKRTTATAEAGEKEEQMQEAKEGEDKQADQADGGGMSSSDFFLLLDP